MCSEIGVWRYGKLQPSVLAFDNLQRVSEIELVQNSGQCRTDERRGPRPSVKKDAHNTYFPISVVHLYYSQPTQVHKSLKSDTIQTFPPLMVSMHDTRLLGKFDQSSVTLHGEKLCQAPPTHKPFLLKYSVSSD